MCRISVNKTIKRNISFTVVIQNCLTLNVWLCFFFAEFDKFLAERAKEADNLPDLNPDQSSQQQRGGRQLQTDEAENALFAL